jgi:hypothetical protein
MHSAGGVSVHTFVRDPRSQSRASGPLISGLPGLRYANPSVATLVDSNLIDL